MRLASHPPPIALLASIVTYTQIAASQIAPLVTSKTIMDLSATPVFLAAPSASTLQHTAQLARKTTITSITLAFLLVLRDTSEIKA